ncbi:MAG TPA: carboxypeptidase regulatory-like domain-containing protein [Thermoanaerobaculia bacterium]|nr:carboxypeptidase regulatory-like domain-containing protein [Thermoanaerobaculia bacterium]
MAASASAAKINGTVTDSGNGIHLPNMVVAAYNVTGTQQVAFATTDSNGNYTLTLSPGSYRLLAYDNAHTYATTYAGDADSFETSTITTVTGDGNGPSFALRRAGTITGTVVAASSGTPLAGMTVAAYNSGSGTRRGFTQTDSAGKYTLVLPPGPYRVAAYADNGTYSARFYNDQPSFATAADINVVSGQSAALTNLRLALSSHVSGNVIDADTNLPLSNKIVVIYTTDGTQLGSVVTDALGNFTATLAAGDYKLVAADTSRIYATGYIGDANSFTNEPYVSTQAGQNMSGVQIPMHRAGVVNGEIVDASNAPLAGITVAAYNDDGTQRATTQTSSSGAYSLLLPPGSYRIAAYDPSLVYATEFYPDRILFNDARPVTVIENVTLNGIDVSLVQGGKISGTITDRQSGAAIGGITVAAYDADGNLISSGTSASNGKFALVVPAGAYRFIAFDNQLRYITAYSGGASNFETAGSMSVAAASTNQLNFALGQGVRLSGSVVDQSAPFTPVSDVEIGALDAAGNRVASATVSAGTFNLVVAPGTYRLLVTDPLGRFSATFYNSAATLAGATPVVVTANGTGSPITILLSRAQRRRSVRH